MKRYYFLRVVCIFLTLLVVPVCVSALEESALFYVNDNANVLSEETETTICDENFRLYVQCRGAEVVVVTVDFLDGRSSEEYAYQLFNDWALGDSQENNGVLILLSPGEEKYWITAGTGLTEDLSAGVLDEILSSNMESSFDAEEYDQAALDTFRAVVNEIDEKYGVTSEDISSYYSGSNEAAAPSDSQENYSSTKNNGESRMSQGLSIGFGLSLLGCILIFFFLVGTIGNITTRRHRSRMSSWEDPPPPPPPIYSRRRSPPPPHQRYRSSPPPPSGEYRSSPPPRQHRPSGGGMTRGGGAGRSSGSSSRPSSSTGHPAPRGGGRPSGGSGRMGGGGSSRGGGAGRR